jgi:hypothetical protein
MQRENRLKEDEVRPRRDPAFSYERAQMRATMDRRSRSRGRSQSRSRGRSRGRSYGDNHVQTNLTAHGGLSAGDGSTEVYSTSSLSTADIPEVLQSLLRRVKGLEDELADYKDRDTAEGRSPLRRRKKKNPPDTGQKSITSAAEQEEF